LIYQSIDKSSNFYDYLLKYNQNLISSPTHKEWWLIDFSFSITFTYLFIKDLNSEKKVLLRLTACFSLFLHILTTSIDNSLEAYKGD